MGGSYPRSRDWPLTPEQVPPADAKAIKLTQRWVAWVDEADYGQLSQFNWMVSTTKDKAYARRSIYPFGRGRAVTETMHGVLLNPSSGMDVDHREHRFAIKVVDNRRSNLRVCTRQQNCFNQRRPNTDRVLHSQYKGVTWRTNNSKWMAQIWVRPKKVHLGDFDNELYAALAYDYAARQHYGEFALTNFATVEGHQDVLLGV